MIKVTTEELNEILKRNKFCIVHVDANWDNYRFQVKELIGSAGKNYSDKVFFAYVDCDEEKAYAKEIGLMNIPSIAYYSGTELKSLIIGAHQNMERNIECLINNLPVS
jgi:thioredoxin-like negative regulator of GroEL